MFQRLLCTECIHPCTHLLWRLLGSLHSLSPTCIPQPSNPHLLLTLGRVFAQKALCLSYTDFVCMYSECMNAATTIWTDG
jgi:hypothetical protein